MIQLVSLLDWTWILWWIGSFWIGFLCAWWIWARYKKYKHQAEALEADLESANLRVKRTDKELADAKATIRGLKSDVETCGQRKQVLQSKVFDLQGQVDRMKDPDAFVLGNSNSTTADEKVEAIQTESKYSKLAPTNLQIIEGIGPKMEAVLNENQVTTWKELAAKSDGELRDILAGYGDKYKIIDPTFWPPQANMAAHGLFDKLIEFQRKVGSATGEANTASKLEKLSIKLGIIKKWKKNDLKIVEGIGPKIEKLLKEAGLDSWKKLSKASFEDIRTVLDGGGAKFKIADPTTWPQQSRLAYEGKFDELEALQEVLKGGRPA